MLAARRRRFLIDVWTEAREDPPLPAVIRARIRDLTSEGECYVGSIEEIAQALETFIGRRADEPGRGEHT